jgi:hypothetical protein
MAKDPIIHEIACEYVVSDSTTIPAAQDFKSAIEQCHNYITGSLLSVHWKLVGLAITPVPVPNRDHVTMFLVTVIGEISRPDRDT